MAGEGKGKPTKLAGWKEIAAYVGREVRTVQRWERELGLPVYRVPGSHGHSVFADPRQIECWFQSGNVRSALTEKDLRQFTLRSGHSPVTVVPLQPVPERPSAAAGIQSTTATKPLWRFRKRAALLALAVLPIAVFLYSSPGHRLMTLLGSGQPVISSVTPILPEADQTIVILGHGLGTYTSFNNLDTPYLVIRDNSIHWSAGRIIPENQDEITLNVSRWTDSEIVITGLAGAYGQKNWVLNPSDKIEIAVWNPQTGAGPALYHLNVTPSAEADPPNAPGTD
jgi:hypothetical protein